MSTSQPDHLKFLYELSEEFCVLPTFIVWKAMSATSGVYTDDKYGINIDPTQVNTRSVSRPASPSLTHPVTVSVPPTVSVTDPPSLCTESLAALYVTGKLFSVPHWGCSITRYR